MKNTALSLLFLLFYCITFFEVKAQAPEKMSYQAVVRDASGALIKSAPVGFKFSILQYTTSGSSVYEEIQTITTNINGVATAIIGNGTIALGSISGINWTEGPYFIKVETDPSGGTAYSISSTNQLLSVPYALYAKTSGRDSVIYAKHTGRDSVVYATTSGRDSVVYAKYSGRDSVVYARFSGSTLVDTITWKLKGNSGTNPDSNYIGTTDNKDIIFRRNKIFAGTLSDSNTAFGLNALNDTTTGLYNTAIGINALKTNSSGTLNTAIGNKALNNNKTGGYNTAIGTNAMDSNVNGSWNTAIGFNALSRNKNGTDNVAIGQYALGGNSSGNDNVGIGQSALGANSTGSYNIALGYFANRNNSSGFRNVSLGYQALTNNTSGNSNVAIGSNSLSGNSTGYLNVAVGAGPLSYNTSGSSNCAIGYEALFYNKSGDNNCAFGSGALWAGDTSKYNAGFGHMSLHNTSKGNFNTGLGANSDFASTSFVNNTICIGYNSGGVSNVSNRAEIGNTSMTWIGGQVSWSTYSDKRIKKDVVENVPGLSFITKLRPVTYHIDAHNQYQMLAQKGKIDTSQWAEKYDIEKITQTGFIAQEVAAAAKASSYDFSGVEIPKNDGDLYSVRYSDFVMPLVKAMQEQQTEIEAQKELIKKLEQRLSALENKK